MSIGPSAAAVVAALLLLGAFGLGTARAAPGEPPPARPSSCSTVLAGDYDGDGLSNYQECQLGTSSVSTDTDRDFLADPDELTLGSNPTNPNSDGDAVRDGCEFSWNNAYGVPLDPAVSNADSDGDAIPNALETWGGTNPYSNDTDQDVLRDGDEWNICTFKAPIPGPALALDPDRDDDGLLDGIEVVSTGTDPNEWDTDGDGWSDYTEVYDYGTDPLDASDKPSGYPPDHP
jgi:hypothetical protein